MKKTYDIVFTFVETLCKLMIALQVISVVLVVIGRYVFNSTPVWAEELTLFCLVWVSLIGAMLPLRNNSHLKMTIFDPYVPKKVLGAVKVFSYLVIVVFSIFTFIAGLRMTMQSWKTILHGIKISKGFLFASVPVSMVLYLFAISEKIYDKIRIK